MKSLSTDTGVSSGNPAVAQCVPASASNPIQNRGVVTDAEAAAGHFPELIPAQLGTASEVMPICYRRAGRSMRGRGVVVGCYANGSLRIQPARAGWKQVIVTPMEIAAAGELPTIPHPVRPDPENAEKDALPIHAANIATSRFYPLWKHLHTRHGLNLSEAECDAVWRAGNDLVEGPAGTATPNANQPT